jgi:hypothetical protein
MSNSLTTPQFNTAEYTASPGHCQFCQQAIGETYYRVNSATACPSCIEKMRTDIAVDSHAAFVRALVYGIGAAVLGIIGYALVAILLQGWVISYMSIGVGWLVGTAMMKGSNGLGGRRYQIAATLLTYAAVSLAAIPIWIHFAEQHKPRQTQQQNLDEEQRQLEQEYGQRPASPRGQSSTSRPAPARETPSPLQILASFGKLALLGLASPFIELSGNLFWGAMGLLILFFGMRIAWRIAAGKALQIYGPFADSPAAS